MLVPSHPPSREAYQDGVSCVVAIYFEPVDSIAKLLKPRRTGVVTLSLRARDSRRCGEEKTLLCRIFPTLISSYFGCRCDLLERMARAWSCETE